MDHNPQTGEIWRRTALGVFEVNELPHRIVIFGLTKNGCIGFTHYSSQLPDHFLNRKSFLKYYEYVEILSKETIEVFRNGRCILVSNWLGYLEKVYVNEPTDVPTA